ncbi:N-acetylmuramoyl-L-alanine amidase [Gudongella sp. DL1XJH-153]|uniref:N-acetylmuramoyl-L-alanine amidase n=1 Tax=Gudongella sp. DL1XJH-153 TaxID=3409804 RepID=UPI003BB560EA
MRRIILTSIILLFITLFSVSFGNSVDINVNGSAMAVPRVAVVMDGKSTNSEFSSFIMGDRTLVPIRFVAESFGADVGWNAATRTATVTHKGSQLDLTIDSNVVLVNGNAMTLEENSIPKLVTYTSLNEAKTMVPVRFVSEIMGYEVGWDASSYTAMINTPKTQETGDERTISGIHAEEGWNGNYRIRIQTDGELKYKTMFLPASNKLVLDVENTILDVDGSKARPGDVIVDDELISRLQYSQFTISPYTTRIVMTLNKEEDFRIVQEDGEAYVLFQDDQLEKPEEPVRGEDPEEDEDDDEDEYTGPKMIRQEIVNGKQAIVVYGVESQDYHVMKISDPTRLVIDIMDTKIIGELYQEYDYRLNFIKGVRASQFDSNKTYGPDKDVVRVVLDVMEGTRDPGIIVMPERGRLVILPEENAWDAFQYENRGTESVFEFRNLFPTQYDIDYDELRKEIEITLPVTATDLPDGTFQIGDQLVRDVSVERGRNETKIIIRFRRGVVYSVLSRPEEQVIRLQAIRNEVVLPQNTTIVVDAGHGGKDPGAVKGNINEKDINLQTSFKLRDALLARGYNVIMTRDTDVFIDLYSRPRIANENNADLFISLHANATMSSSINGLEILYCPAYESDKKMYDQFPFAEFIYNGILDQTGRTGRGIIKRPELVVLRETEMPAVLVETGYMTNPEELTLVLSDRYQNQVVDGIINAVEQYFKEY